MVDVGACGAGGRGPPTWIVPQRDRWWRELQEGARPVVVIYHSWSWSSSNLGSESAAKEISVRSGLPKQLLRREKKAMV